MFEKYRKSSFNKMYYMDFNSAEIRFLNAKIHYRFKSDITTQI